jgi:hypothetical protein
LSHASGPGSTGIRSWDHLSEELILSVPLVLSPKAEGDQQEVEEFREPEPVGGSSLNAPEAGCGAFTLSVVVPCSSLTIL